MLAGMASCAVAWASHELVETYGFPTEVVAHPTADHLVDMLGALSPPLARCALYGLLRADAADLPAAALAVRHRASLAAAADREPSPHADRAGPSARYDGDAATGRDAIDHGEKKVEQRMTTGDGPADDAVRCVDGVGQARGLAADLRSAGAELARELEDIADDLRDGRLPAGRPGDLAGALSAWVRDREDLTRGVAALGGSWPAEAAYAALETELDRLDRLLVERAELKEQLEKLHSRAAQYELLIAGAEGEAEVGGLRTALEDIRGKIARIGATLADGKPSSDDLAADTMSADSAGLRETGPRSDDAHATVPWETTAPETHEETSAAAPSQDARPDITPTLRPERERDGGRAAGRAADSDAEREPASPTQVPSVAVDAEAEAEVETEVDAESVEAPPAEALSPEPQRTVGDRVLPWSAGGRTSHVAGLVGRGKLPDAYWMTKASDEPADRAQALAFASAAFSCAGVDDATRVQMTYDVTPAGLIDDREAHLTATVAAIRSGLTAGWPHALVSDFSMPSGLSVPWQQLLMVLVTAVRECHTYTPGRAEDVPEGEQQRLTMKDIQEDARVLLEDLPRRKIKYQRASRVLQYLTGPSGELRQALGTVLAWACGTDDGAALHPLGEKLRRAEYVERLIEDADSRFRTPKQAKEAIHSGALRQLQAAIRSVSELVTKAEGMAAAARIRSAAAGPKLPQLDEALAEVKSYEVSAGVGGAALGLLGRWLTGEFGADVGTAAVDTDNLAHPSDDCLLLLPDLPRDADGNPDFADGHIAASMTTLLAPPSPDTVFTTYLERGDLHLARDLVRLVERNSTDGTGASAEWVEDAVRRLREAEKAWRRKVAERHGVAATHLAQIRTLNLMPTDKEREFTGRLQQFADGDEVGRYQYALSTLGEFVRELTELVEDSTRRLRDRLDTLKLDPERPLSDHDHDRILRLIDEGDTVTAQEFLALAEGGERLPDRPEDESAELRDFLAGLTGAGAPVPGGDGVPAGWWADRYGSGAKLTPNGEKGLASWKALCTKKGRNSEWSRHVPEVLRLLGLTPVGSFHPEKAGQGVRRFRGRATVSEGAGYVAALGSRATSYTVLLIWEEQRADGPLAHLDAADVDANIVLYLHPLGPEGRRTLSEVSRRTAQQALVVDPAVIGWMAARSPGGFRALQRVTLPWAAYDPYTPFVAGAVPPEVFYGRDRELREVMNPEGGLFLYGGRQLGKSALLRRVAELFPSRSDSNVAVYLDLVKAEVGQAESPERIWKLLADDLKRQNVLDPKKVSERAGPDVVANGVRSWLDEDESRRLLILADEADAFLTADSRRIFHSGGESTFQNVKKFQNLMEQTDRRLKVVFAGLHQVQRFGELSNVSTAHGGPDVLVGPLNPSAAVQLVTEPMAALGFVFDRPELVWRILAITNYQANLVQIFCSELVQSLLGRTQRGRARPTSITEADVQEVAASETVRRRLAERLRFTINLEDRYRVLTLVIALQSLADGYRGDYTADELLRRAQEAWPEGFQGLGMKQIQIYLMEMVGLGLLVQLGDRSRFAVRSPNVVNMLGTREELELELRETEFSQPYEYDPRAARRLLGRDPGSSPQRYVTRYSPLTEGQLHEAAQPGVTVIGATPLYRPQLMLAATERFADARGVEVRTAKAADDLRSVLADASRLRKSYVLALDLRGLDEAGLVEAVRACVEHAGPPADSLVRQTEGRKRSAFRSVFVLADALPAGALQELREEAQIAARFLRPERWSVESLRAWPECPFVSRAERTRLIQVTGGWAPWVELAIAEVVTNGATLDSALDLVGRKTKQPDNLDRHCELAGLERQDLDLLALWSGYVSEGEGVSRDEVASAVELPERDAEDWLVRLDRLGVLEAVEGGIAVDRVTFRAVRARCAQG